MTTHNLWKESTWSQATAHRPQRAWTAETGWLQNSHMTSCLPQARSWVLWCRVRSRPSCSKNRSYISLGDFIYILVTTCLTLVPSLLHSTFVITGWTSVSTSSDWWNPVEHIFFQTRHSRLRTQVNMVEIHVQRYEQMKMLQWYECGAAYNLSAKKTFFGKISVILSFASYNHL